MTEVRQNVYRAQKPGESQACDMEPEAKVFMEKIGDAYFQVAHGADGLIKIHNLANRIPISYPVSGRLSQDFLLLAVVNRC